MREAKDMRAARKATEKEAEAPAPPKGKRKRAAKADEEEHDEPVAGLSKAQEASNEDDESVARVSKRRRQNEPEQHSQEEPKENVNARPKRSGKPTLKVRTTANTEDDAPTTSSGRPRATRTRTRGQASTRPAEIIEPDGDSSPGETGPVLKRISGWEDEDPRQPARKRSKR